MLMCNLLWWEELGVSVDRSVIEHVATRPEEKRDAHV